MEGGCGGRVTVAAPLGVLPQTRRGARSFLFKRLDALMVFASLKHEVGPLTQAAAGKKQRSAAGKQSKANERLFSAFQPEDHGCGHFLCTEL